MSAADTLTLEEATDLLRTEPEGSLLHRAAHAVVQLTATLACHDGAIVLAGWRCASCFAWNSDEKERRTECRCCAAGRS